MYDRTELLLLAHAKAAADRITLRTLSKKVFGPMNDKTFVRLDAGHGCNADSLATASAWFNANADRSWWPEAVPWPLETPRGRGRGIEGLIHSNTG